VERIGKEWKGELILKGMERIGRDRNGLDRIGEERNGKVN